MSSTTKLALGVAVLAAAGAAACNSDSATSPSTASSVSANLLSTAFTSAAPGYDQLASSFNASGSTGSFGPGGGHGGHGGGLGFGDLMGGGLGGDFLGGGFGPGFGRGAFGDPRGGAPLSTCAFDAATGRITCAAVTVNGLTTNRYAIYTNAAGQAQQAFDTTTDKAVTHVDVSGTTTFTPRNHHGFGHGFGPDSASVSVASATSTVTSASDRTVTGLASGSTQRTVNGTSAAQESSTGKLSDSSSFSSTRVMGDTTTGLVIPVKTSGYAYPTAGTVIRASTASVTTTSGTKTASRREVITYDGSTTAKVVIVQNDTTKNCTLPLPRGRLSCS